VVISNSAGTVTSNDAVLTVNPPPVITTQPATQTVVPGAIATFSVTATGAGPLTYQWRKNGTNISGATAATYSTPPTTTIDNNTQFSVMVSNPAGATFSTNATLKVIAPPFIVGGPNNQTVVVGQLAQFTISVTGGDPLTYQWRRNGVNIPGATAEAYFIQQTTMADNGAIFSVVVTNPTGTATSPNAVLTVTGPPVITVQPAPVTASPNGLATFSVTATGAAPLNYQWRKNGVNVTGGGGNSFSYTTTVTAADNGALFSVVVSNTVGSVTSNNALLTVSSAPVITSQPVSITVAQGDPALFSVTATGAPAPTYQWRRNGIAIAGATSPAYSAASTPSENGAQFSVVVSNSQGSVTSVSATLTVISPPVITVPPAAQTALTGQSATFSVTASGSLPLFYQWRKNGTDIVGATAATYTTPATVSADNGALFAVVVSNQAASVTSGTALLTVISVANNSHKLAVSGELVDVSGNPLGYPAPVTVDAIVNLYNDSATGTSLYTEAFRAAAGKGIRVSNGLFVARLGEGTTSQVLQQVLAANGNLWVEVTIDDGTPDILRPRTPLTAAPYALGGTPAPTLAPAVAPALTGSGDPNALGIDGQVGATYVNSADNSTWFKLKSSWKRLD